MFCAGDLLFVFEYLEEVVRAVVAHDEVLMHVDRYSFRCVDVAGDDALEGARRPRSVAGTVHDDTAVALVGYQQVEPPIETQPSRLVELFVSRSYVSAVPQGRAQTRRVADHQTNVMRMQLFYNRRSF